MTLQETAALIVSIGKMWPSWLDKRDVDGTVKLWQKVFADDDARVIGQALGVFFASDTKGFAPVPGQLKEIALKIQGGDDQLSEQEAWALVSKAASNAAYHADEEFRKLPPVCRQIVGSPTMLREYSQMDADELHTVVASNFMRSYRVRAEQEREYAKLPSSLRTLMPAIKQIGALPGERVTALPEPTDAIEMPDSVRQAIMAAYPEKYMGVTA